MNPAPDPLAEARAFLASLPDFESGRVAAAHAMGLERMRALLALLDHPDREMLVVHLAGTKGKGSTSAMIAAALTKAGATTGLYTSPHLVEMRERIRVNGIAISADELAAQVLQTVKPAAERLDNQIGTGPLHFEAELAIALCYFRQQHVQVAVLEVGLGGRLDATNAVSDPALSVLTTIGYDHMAILGHTLTEIAAEKAAIVRRGGQVVCAPQPPEAMEVIERVCQERGAQLITIGPNADWTWQIMHSDRSGLLLHVDGQHGIVYDKLGVALMGRHQAINATVAVAALHVLMSSIPAVTPRAVRAGLAAVYWPGRCQIVGEDPIVLLDGAHNIESAQALAQVMDDLALPQPIVLIIGSSVDKDMSAIAAPLVYRVTLTLATQSSHPRAATPEAMVAAVNAARFDAQVRAVGTPMEALTLARRIAGSGGSIVATGSLHLVGDLLDGLGLNPATQSILGAVTQL